MSQKVSCETCDHLHETVDFEHVCALDAPHVEVTAWCGKHSDFTKAVAEVIQDLRVSEQALQLACTDLSNRSLGSQQYGRELAKDYKEAAKKLDKKDAG